ACELLEGDRPLSVPVRPGVGGSGPPVEAGGGGGPLGPAGLSGGRPGVAGGPPRQNLREKGKQHPSVQTEGCSACQKTSVEQNAPQFWRGSSRGRQPASSG